MGQRLNIEIKCGETELANCYYHWSAYTSSALKLTKKIIDAYYDLNETNKVELAVRLLESTGGGVNDEERCNIDKEPDRFGGITFKSATSRNDGLISVTEHGMWATRKWEEGRVTIDLLDETFSFDVVSCYSEEDYNEDFDEQYCDPIDELPNCPLDLSNVQFEDIDQLIQFVNDNPRGAIDEEIIYRWIA